MPIITHFKFASQKVKGPMKADSSGLDFIN